MTGLGCLRDDYTVVPFDAIKPFICFSYGLRANIGIEMGTLSHLPALYDPMYITVTYIRVSQASIFGTNDGT